MWSWFKNAQLVTGERGDHMLFFLSLLSAHMASRSYRSATATGPPPQVFFSHISSLCAFHHTLSPLSIFHRWLVRPPVLCLFALRDVQVGRTSLSYTACSLEVCLRSRDKVQGQESFRVITFER